ncbi:hypothetical protein MCOR25_001838 [Pyricularia grisea]|uniref:XPG-I domain-containing protein n=1 Tax=Pyricularia grisea TaxID=148305 RepID=A0A6P8BE18_PYRGI|nr:uncharacterized protein PgNI_03690 [Pyricularia grisea]KAI6379939.1 hypothetical protein MCOR25_001838 [Pyricularia grisea]TLD13989.1 hypothetical protein PgNI_03690 [Pyricularia grisea]
MGIKGIYPEIGPGERISLCKLAIQTLEEKRRPLRIAIDISIWQFQIQAARGGANAPTRTLFYRLARLLGHSIQPIFVFDGPNKPAFKRNRRSTTRGGATGDVVSNAMAKRMIRLFGFQFHDAPGEAEAECALLQRRGIVDAVLSEDVDTIMFGCTRTLRNWSSEGVRGSKEPTHVSMYDSAAIKAQHSGLDREGMVLVALMSGGDYIPQGVPGCGVKVACEAARGGFGHSLCRIKKSDIGALAEWKEKLLAELRDNKSGFFRVRHKALVIPDDFPSLEVLRYYTHPVVSQDETLERLENSFPSNNSLDVQGLRQFVAETFDWTGKLGAIKFIRVLAPSLLVQKLLQKPSAEETDMEHLIKDISKSRTHFTTDGTKEVRVSFVPTSIIDIDLDKEPEESPEAFGRGGLALNSDDDLEELELGGNGESGAARPGPKKVFDPTQPCSEWIPELVLQFGAPKALRDWHTKLEAKSATAQKVSNTTRTRKSKTANIQSGGLDKFLTVTKKPCSIAKAVVTSESQVTSGLATTKFGPGTHNLPATKIIHTASGQSTASARNSSKQSNTINTKKPQAKSNTNRQVPLPSSSSRKAAASKPASATTNPWTIASSQPSRSSNRPFSRTNTYSHAGHGSSARPSTPGSAPDEQLVFISSSPPISGPSPETSLNNKRSPVNDKKHPRRSPEPEDSYELDPFSSDSSPYAPSPRKQRSPTAKLGKTESSDGQRQVTPPTIARGAGTSNPVARSRKLASVLGYAGEPRFESRPAGLPEQQADGGLCDDEGELESSRPKFISPYSIVDLSDDEGDEQHSRQSRPISTASIKQSLDGRTSPDHSTVMRSGLAVGSSVHISRSGEILEDEFVHPSPKITTSAKPNTTKLYIPRKSAVGFIREVEVSREEADRLMREQSGSGGGGRGRMFRRSDISFVDLTGSSP